MPMETLIYNEIIDRIVNAEVEKISTYPCDENDKLPEAWKAVDILKKG